MVRRIFVTAFLALIISLVVFAVVTALNPQSLMLTEPFVCEAWQTLTIQTRQLTPTEFTIDATCIGDGEVAVGARTLLTMFFIYFLPIFLVVWVLSVLGSRADGQNHNRDTVIGNPHLRDSANVQSFTVTSTTANPQAIAEVLGVVQAALSDAVITPDEFAQIKEKAMQVSSADVQSLSQRLADLRQAYEQGLITEAEYENKRRDILDTF